MILVGLLMRKKLKHKFQQKIMWATNGKKLSCNTDLLLALQDRKEREQENKGHTVLQLTLTHT